MVGGPPQIGPLYLADLDEAMAATAEATFLVSKKRSLDIC